MSNSQPSDSRELGDGITGAEPGEFEINDITGNKLRGTEEEVRAEWAKIVNDPDRRINHTIYDELRLVEVKAVHLK